MKTTRRETLLTLLGLAAAVVLPKPTPPPAFVYPPPVTFQSSAFMEPIDQLEDAYQDSIQQIMEAEDRVWLNLVRKT